MTESASPSLRTRLVILCISSLVTLGLAEVLVRFVDNGAMPMIHLFTHGPDKSIILRPGSQMRVASGQREPWTLRISEAGFRVTDGTPSPAPGHWLALGDSQVMGSGVEADATFSAWTRLSDGPVHNAGVPGYGVEDALRAAAPVIAKWQPAGVIIVINQMNDWDEVSKPIETATLDDIAFAQLALQAKSSALYGETDALRRIYDMARKNGALGADNALKAVSDGKEGQ